jgi:transcriptional regulator with XRE-family HTH domain
MRKDKKDPESQSIQVRIGGKIKKLRELKGLNQESMAQEIGLSTNGYGKIERGESSLSMERLDQIARALEVSTLDILQFDDNIVYNINTMNSSAPNGIVNNYSLTEEERRLLVDQIKTLHTLLNSQAALIESLMRKREI